MSKKSKKKNVKKSNTTKKPVNKLKIIIPAVLIAVVAAIIAAVAVYSNTDVQKIKSSLCSKEWTPISATNASGDEVDMAQVYNSKYSNYKGSLKFNSDNTFSFWMSPGDSSDGTHSGKYEVADNQTLNMYFDNAANTVFKISSEKEKVISIEVNYDDYKILFMTEE